MDKVGKKKFGIKISGIRNQKQDFPTEKMPKIHDFLNLKGII